MADTAIDKVFGIPELLEYILSNVPPLEILSSMRVQRRWSETISGSVILRRLLGLEPFPGPHFHSPFLLPFPDMIGLHKPQPLARCLFQRFRDIAVIRERNPWFPDNDVDDDDNDNDNDEDGLSPHADIGFIIARDSDHRLLRHIGSRVREMALCHPPLRYVAVYIDCGCCHEFIENHPRKGAGKHSSYFRAPIPSTRPEGLTIGDIADHVRHSLATKHVQCRRTSVRIIARARLALDDPVFAALAAAKEAQKGCPWLDPKAIEEADAYDESDRRANASECSYCEAFWSDADEKKKYNDNDERPMEDAVEDENA